MSVPANVILVASLQVQKALADKDIQDGLNQALPQISGGLVPSLDELLAERDKINMKLQKIIDEQTDPWGVKVTNVEVKDVELPDTMKRAMAAQAEAERERRAKIINAEGEYQASQRLSEAAAILEKHPAAIQLRFLQTVASISSDKSSTVIIPVPIDLLQAFVKK